MPGTPGNMTRIENTSTPIKAHTAAVTTAIGISNAAFGFSADELAAADYAVISVITNNANILWDGSTPTTTFGHPVQTSMLGVGIEGNAKINLLKFVSQVGTSNVTVTLERYGL